MLSTLLCGGRVTQRKAPPRRVVLLRLSATRLHLRELRERKLAPLERLVQREGQREDDSEREKRPVDVGAKALVYACRA